MPRRRIISSQPDISQNRWDELPQVKEEKITLQPPRRPRVGVPTGASERQVPKGSLRGKIPLVLLLASAVLFVFAIYSYWSISQKAGKIGENIKQSAQSTNNSKILIDKVSRLILLPKNELPSIATINNVALLQKDSSFYKDARNGDILLIYFQAKRAFIYNPAQNIIINTGPVLMEKMPTDASAVSTSTTSTP